MVIYDVLRVLNGYPLKQYPWGEQVVEIVNAYVDKKHEISLESTKAMVYEAINSLPHTVKHHLLKRVVITTADDGPIINTIPINQVPVKPFPVGYLPYGKSVVAVVLALTIVLASGVIAMRVSVEADHASALPSSDSATLVRYVSDILLTLSNDLSKTQEEKAKKHHYRLHVPTQPDVAPSPGSSVQTAQKASGSV